MSSRIGEQADAGATSRDAYTVEPITMRVPDACRYIGVSRSTLYVLISEGEIEIVKLGCSTLVLTESLKALIAKRRGPIDISSDQTGM
jgi:excisionase family DNA binding protein